ncbi:MAG: efflux RND transporter periplasmic adaptor subunit, partial [bacterium]
MAQPQTYAKVRKDTLLVELVETGEVGAVNSTIVSAPPIWSQDLQIIDMVPEGTRVDSGAVLVQLDRASLLTKLAATQTELDGHRADLRKMRTEQQARISEMKRSGEMADYTLKLSHVQLEQLQYESASRRENGKLEVLKAEIALKESKTKLEAQAIIHDAEEKKQLLKILQSQGQVNEINRQLNQLTLRAPISGLAVYHPDWNGSKPAIGEKVRPGRGIIDLPDLSRMQVKIRVNEIDAARLLPSQAAQITLDAFPSKQFRGRLVSTTKIAAIKEENSQVRVFETIVHIAESDSLLKPGMTAQVKLQLDVLPDATIIPIGCVFEVGGQPVVFTKNSPKKPTPVKLGARDDFNI